MDCSPILSFLKIETSTWRAPSGRADDEFAPVKATYDKLNRGTQRWFPTKYIENTFKAIQSTLSYLEMHSKRSYKSCIFSVILGELEPFRNYQGLRVIFPKIVGGIWRKTKVRHFLILSAITFLTVKILGSFFSTKNSLTWEVKCEH